GHECLDHIAYLHVAVTGDRDTALHSVADFRGVFLEAPQRSNLTLEHLHVIAQQSHFGIALDDPVLYVATSNHAHLRDAERIAHFRAALVGLFDYRFEQAGHRLLDLVLQFVNDRVQTNIDLFLFGQFLRHALWTNVEADDDRLGG